jgi:cell division protein FtsW
MTPRGSSGRKQESPAEQDYASPVAARLLVLSVLVLFGISLTMLVSIGIGQAQPLFYPVRQTVWGMVALAACLFTARVPTRFWKHTMPALCLATIVLLMMARLVGRNINDAHRWLSLGPVNFQPSEFAKLSAMVWIAFWLSMYRRRSREFVRGFLLPGAGLGFLCVMVLIGPDFGTTMLIGGSGVFVMYIGGTRVVYLLGAVLLAGGGLGALIWRDPERLSRITSFLNPEKYASDDAYQLMNSLYAFIEGGLTGKGIGNSLQKFSYLPEAHTNFILAILAEELGMIGVAVVLGLYGMIFLAGMRIAWRSPDSFSRLLGFGITVVITLQACINIGVVTGSMPTKGLPLPFVSYGGSSLVFMAAMVGILIRIALGSTTEPERRRALRSGQEW